MISRCFVDTSAWFSLLVAVDRNHSQVQNAYMQVYRNGALFITSSLVLGELYTLTSSRKGPIASFWSFRDKVLASKRIRLINPEPNQLDAAFNLLRHRPDKSYSFVDATSFVLMRDESIHTALTLDRHFAQEGFVVIPGLEERLHETGQLYRAEEEPSGTGP